MSYLDNFTPDTQARGACWGDLGRSSLENESRGRLWECVRKLLGGLTWAGRHRPVVPHTDAHANSEQVKQRSCNHLNPPI